jgi:hypothetical protein
MKLSQLKQIIKEEIEEAGRIGFPHSGDNFDTPSPYEKGIDDALKVLKDIGVLDVEDNVLALIKRKVLDPTDEFPIPNDSTPPIVNEEFDNRRNAFYNIFLQTYYSMNKHKITFDEATDKLFTWIKANFK